MEKIEKARVFKNGRSQAVRIPAQYRFKSDEVYIRRNPNTGELILSERPLPPSLDEIYARLDAAGAADFVLDRDPAPPIERESL
ncbi:MAG: AbrB/MazE/SpoVT family DNA-binding domain-containing protein [Acidobacteriota bacterium]|nr:AbrB/MazE/SpoVT family DNA-binding domain-containing protein [Acidobacteriota bacterium]